MKYYLLHKICMDFFALDILQSALCGHFCIINVFLLAPLT